MKIIPAIDMRGGRCVRLFQGDYSKETIYGDDPATQALKWEADGAELIHLVDLDGAKAGNLINLDAIGKICASVKIPCELGGGIRTFDDAETAFKLGVSRIILGTAACENPQVAEEFTNRFGPDKIVVGIDAKNGNAAVRGWVETSSVDAFSLARKLYLMGVNRIIYTDIATDGALSGPNLESIRKLCTLLPDCNIIASGGISGPCDIRNLRDLNLDNLEGVIVGKALYDGRAHFAELSKAAAPAAEPGE